MEWQNMSELPTEEGTYVVSPNGIHIYTAEFNPEVGFYDEDSGEEMAVLYWLALPPLPGN